MFSRNKIVTQVVISPMSQVNLIISIRYANFLAYQFSSGLLDTEDIFLLDRSR